jgi:hypothetical protein
MAEQANEQQTVAAETSLPLKPVRFVSRESEQVPTFSADGAWGAMNHFNMIRLSFYTENPPIPTAVVQPVDKEGNPEGDPQHHGIIDPNYWVIVRDFQCHISLNLSSAVQIYQMLGSFIKVTQEQMKEQTEAMRLKMAQKKENR